ncbi:origin recognition complex subunit 4 [Bicyclus anynana]|uniref:Origin recognition complex subunit 4 n=1 Tax=Bicyclus anynana TaxID=110368 RepID=A0A6J1NL98_BICAN|nr:origin recognition complex subunit 4 [Bicyclus anynana]
MHEINASQLSTQIKLIRKYLKLKIIEDNITFRDHASERKHVYELITKAVLHGESHSALIIGPRGCGKTALINSVLHQVSKEADLVNDAIVVKLNGLIHHDDKVALKSITAQMQLENAVGDRVFGTFAENLSFLLSCLMSGTDRRCKSMVFILEQFDMFCHSTRTQTLLYNLFDITHSKQAPMCVLGVTNRIDVMELLEKRVKSRFSHRHIFIFPNENTENSEVKSPLSNCKEMLVQCLSMPLALGRRDLPKKRKGRKSIVSNEEVMDIDSTDSQYSIPEQILTKCRTDVKQFQHLEWAFLEDWNSHVQSLVQDQKLVDSLEKLCYYTVNEQIIKDILFQTVSKLSPSKPYIDAIELSNTIDETVSSEQRVKLLQSLSILELSLVIAMMHGIEIFDGQPMNFEMVLHRYTKFANANSSNQSVPRPVVLKAFEHLQQLEIIMPSKSTDSHTLGDTSTSRVQKEYKLYTLAAPVHDIKEAIKSYKALPTEITHWFNNTID